MAWKSVSILALKEANRPHGIKGVHIYLGMINYLKRFIPDFSTLTYPIRKLTHQDNKFEWSDDCEKSFQTLNNYFTEKAVNTYFDEKKNTVICCNVTPVGLSSILLQKDQNDNAHVISHSSRSLTLKTQIPQNSQTDSNNSSANCQRIVWVCLTILWNWRLNG